MVVDPRQRRLAAAAGRVELRPARASSACAGPLELGLLGGDRVARRLDRGSTGVAAVSSRSSRTRPTISAFVGPGSAAGTRSRPSSVVEAIGLEHDRRSRSGRGLVDVDEPVLERLHASASAARARIFAGRAARPSSSASACSSSLPGPPPRWSRSAATSPVSWSICVVVARDLGRQDALLVLRLDRARPAWRRASRSGPRPARGRPARGRTHERGESDGDDRSAPAGGAAHVLDQACHGTRRRAPM